MELSLDVVVAFQGITVLVMVAGFIWRVASKGDIKQLDRKIDDTRKELKADIESLAAKTDARFSVVDSRFNAVDSKMEDARKETKADMQRLEDRLQAANEYHARSVELLDAIRRELEDRRERL
ncbi:MAG: hypothetical protein OXG68_04555 [Chloroflexi bacterium]|nr:hypothetical protein [Chloroflexota bacterium]